MIRKIVRFYGIRFSNIGFNELFEKIQSGGILVAPAASGLINIEEDKPKKFETAAAIMT